jgi:hypothetical protein
MIHDDLLYVIAFFGSVFLSVFIWSINVRLNDLEKTVKRLQQESDFEKRYGKES